MSKEFQKVVDSLLSLDNGQDRRKWLRYAGYIPATIDDFKDVQSNMFLLMNEITKFNKTVPKDKQITYPAAAIAEFFPVLANLYEYYDKAKGTNFGANPDQYWPKDASVNFRMSDVPSELRNEAYNASGFVAPTWNPNKVNIRDSDLRTLLHELQHIKYSRNANEDVPYKWMFGLLTGSEKRWARSDDIKKDEVVFRNMRSLPETPKNFAPNYNQNVDEYLANVRANQGANSEGTAPEFPGLTPAEWEHLKNYYK